MKGKRYKSDGIVFRSQGHLYCAPLSGDFICRGSIKRIQALNHFEDLHPSEILIGTLFEIVNNRQQTVHVQVKEKTRVRVEAQYPVDIGHAIYSEPHLIFLQRLIGEALAKKPPSQ